MYKSKTDKSKPILIALIFLSFFFIVIYQYTEYLNNDKEKKVRNNLYDLLITKKSQLEKSLNSRIYYTKGVAAYTSLRPNITNSDFQKLAAQLIKEDSVISTMALSRDCILNSIYPYEGHQEAIGLNLLDHPERRTIVEKTIETHNTFVAGPVELVEGGIAFLSYTPIFDQTTEAEDNFWGMTDIVIWKDKLFNEINLTPQDSLYKYALRGIDGTGYEGEVFMGEEELFNMNPVTVEVLLPTGNWILAGMPLGGWKSYLSKLQMITYGLYVSAIIISILIWLLSKALFEIRAREKELKALFGAMDDLIIKFNRKGQYLSIAPTNDQMLVKERNELIGKSLNDVFDKDMATFFIKAIQECFKTEKMQSLDYKLEINNEIRWFHARITYINPDTVLYIAQDNTHKKLAEEELRQSEQKLRDMNASKDKLFSIIAHDLRSPFNSTMGLLDLLKNDFDDYSNEEIKDVLTQIDNSVKGQFNILENLLNWAQIQTDRLEVNKENIDIYEFIENELTIIKLAADKKEVQIINNITKNTQLVSDKILLGSIIHNLVGNSVKFTNPGGKIEINTEIKDNKVKIIFNDTGIGIEEKNLRNLFKEDFNTSTRGTRGEKGTGLGLFIVKEMTEKLNGTIEVESKLNSGSKFTVVIPLS